MICEGEGTDPLNMRERIVPKTQSSIVHRRLQYMGSIVCMQVWVCMRVCASRWLSDSEGRSGRVTAVFMTIVWVYGFCHHQVVWNGSGMGWNGLEWIGML